MLQAPSCAGPPPARGRTPESRCTMTLTWGGPHTANWLAFCTRVSAKSTVSTPLRFGPPQCQWILESSRQCILLQSLVHIVAHHAEVVRAASTPAFRCSQEGVRRGAGSGFRGGPDPQRRRSARGACAVCGWRHSHGPLGAWRRPLRADGTLLDLVQTELGCTLMRQVPPGLGVLVAKVSCTCVLSARTGGSTGRAAVLSVWTVQACVSM